MDKNTWGTWLTLNPDAKDGTVEEGESPLYRIDMRPPEVFAPRLPSFRVAGECETIPRICVAKDLIHTIVAYNRIYYDGLNLLLKRGDNVYKILNLPAQGAFYPGNSLVPNSDITGERWIVNYDGHHDSIAPQVIGHLWLLSVKFNHAGPNGQSVEATFIVAKEQGATTPLIIMPEKECLDHYKIRILIEIEPKGNLSYPKSYRVEEAVRLDEQAFEILKNRRVSVEHFV